MKRKPENPTTLIVIGVMVLLMWVAACKTLQHQKGYAEYNKNTYWK